MQTASLDLASHHVGLSGETDFSGWRDAARRLALAGVPPEDVAWEVEGSTVTLPLTCLPASSPRETTGKGATSSTMATSSASNKGQILGTTTTPPSPRSLRGEGKGEGRREQPPSVPTTALKVPKKFLDSAEAVICHSDPERFAFLYRLLWRLRTEPNLLHIQSDPDIRRFKMMEKSVRRDIHKMRAFVRFRRILDQGAELYAAWFEPEHYILERNAPFFVRRFTGMNWTIVTPHASARWDGETLAIGPGGRKSDVPSADDAEELWLTYFRNIFNPARLKVKAMQAEMPKKYWRNLPEAVLIPGMIAGAEEAASDMVSRMATTPAPHHARVQAKHWPKTEVKEPGDGSDADTIDELRQAAAGCRRCPLWRDATQVVFGEGPASAQVIFVGEQPGDQEDLAGKPFVGPAGKVFDAILDDSGVDRSKVYVTNAVKRFKFEPRGKRRIHAKPNAGEIQACRWWIDHEIALVRPNLVVALGATAAFSLLGKAIPVTKMRGEVIEREDGLRVFITIHPSFILRIPDPRDKEAERARFLADMKAVKGLMAA